MCFDLAQEIEKRRFSGDKQKNERQSLELAIIFYFKKNEQEKIKFYEFIRKTHHRTKNKEQFEAYANKYLYYFVRKDLYFEQIPKITKVFAMLSLCEDFDIDILDLFKRFNIDIVFLSNKFLTGESLNILLSDTVTAETKPKIYVAIYELLIQIAHIWIINKFYNALLVQTVHILNNRLRLLHHNGAIRYPTDSEDGSSSEQRFTFEFHEVYTGASDSAMTTEQRQKLLKERQKQFDKQEAALAGSISLLPTGDKAFELAGMHKLVGDELQRHANETGAVFFIRQSNPNSMPYFESYLEGHMEVVAKDTKTKQKTNNLLGLLQFDEQAKNAQYNANYNKFNDEFCFPNYHSIDSIGRYNGPNDESTVGGPRILRSSKSTANLPVGLNALTSAHMLVLLYYFIHNEIPEKFRSKFYASGHGVGASLHEYIRALSDSGDFRTRINSSYANHVLIRILINKLQEKEFVTPIPHSLNPIILNRLCVEGYFDSFPQQYSDDQLYVTKDGEKWIIDRSYDDPIPYLSPSDGSLYPEGDLSDVPTWYGENDKFARRIIGTYNPISRFSIQQEKELPMFIAAKLQVDEDGNVYYAPIVSDIDFLLIGFPGEYNRQVQFLSETYQYEDVDFYERGRRFFRSRNENAFNITGSGPVIAGKFLYDLCERLANRISEVRKRNFKDMLNDLNLRHFRRGFTYQKLISNLNKRKKLQLIHHGADVYMPDVRENGYFPSALINCLIISPNNDPVFCRTTDEIFLAMKIFAEKGYLMSYNPYWVCWTENQKQQFLDIVGAKNIFHAYEGPS